MTIFDLTDEQKHFQFFARTFSQKELAPHASDIDRSTEFPRDNLKKLFSLGMSGIISPKEFGGMALSHLTYVCILEELAKGCLTTAAILSVHHFVQFFLKRFATQNQQEKFLPLLAKGINLGAICITEPDAGSDVASLKTIAKRSGNHYIISGVKNFITSAGEADIYIVLVRTDRGLSTFIVEKKSPGISFGERDEKMGYRASSTREVFFDEVTVHADQLILK